MKILKFLLLLLLFSTVNAETVVFGATKEKAILDKNLKTFKKLLSNNKELENIEYTTEKFGDNFVILISKIDNNKKIKSLMLLLKPTFNDIFIVSHSNKLAVNKNNREEDNREKDNSEEDIFSYINQFITKGFFIIILSLLGLIFLYELFTKFRHINKIQKSFKDNQDMIQDKINKIT